MRHSIADLLSSRRPTNSDGPGVVEETVVAFLRQTPPFQFLDEASLRRAVTRAEIQHFPAGAVIRHRGDPAAEYLYVIERGGVKKTLITTAGEEEIVEVCGEGDLFGVLAAVAGEASRLNITALEDTICFAIPRPVVQELLAENPAFARYLHSFSIHHYLDWSLEEIRRGATLGDASGRLLFSGQTRELARTPLVACRETAAVREAARLMTQHGTSSVIVVNESGEAVGIVTDWDLRERVVAAGLDAERPIREVMSTPVAAIAGEEPLFEAVRQMLARGIHHLVVTEAGRPAGMITGHDLMLLHGNSALAIVRDIDRQTSPAGLRPALARAQEIIPFLLRQGVRAGQLGRILAEINDRFVARVLTLTETALGRPPAPYCWIAFGSEGRREQTFKTDQDNALIYADPLPPEADAVRAYFVEFGRRAVGALVEAGFPPCPSGYTADNPRWVQPLSVWGDQFRTWIAGWGAEALFHSLLFFDFRPVHGDPALAEHLRRSVTALVRDNASGLSRLAQFSTETRPPVGFLGRLVVEHGGGHKDEIDLKERGAIPIVDLARFLALERGFAEISTLDRLARAAEQSPAARLDELAQAFEFLLSLRIRQQWEQMRAGQSLSNHVNPHRLSALDRSLLRESFRAIARAQAAVREEHHSRVGRLPF